VVLEGVFVHQFMHSRRKALVERPPTEDHVLGQLEKILASDDFDASPRSRGFLRFVVEETLSGREDELTQESIAVHVFGRKDDFDPTVDPIVRIQAGRLRRSLERYYLLEGAGDHVRIELPRGTYVPVLCWAEPSQAAPKTAGRAPADDDWPTVVATVAGPASPDAALDDAGARFLEHLAVELGRYRDVRVVTRREPLPPGTATAGDAMFALSCRFDDGGRHLIARLVDCRAGSARQAWANEYECGPATPQAFQEETARVVAAHVASEQGVVAKRLWAERRTRPGAPPTPYGAVLDSYQFLFNRDPADLAPAIEALRHVVAVESECALAWVQLSRLYLANHNFEITPVETPIEQALAYAQNGVRLDPSSQRARAALGGALLVRGELEASRAEAQAALDLNPESLVYLEWIGWLLTMAGEWERGPAIVRRALARNPHVIPVAHHALWLAHLHRGEIEAAYQAALQYRDPTFFVRAMMRACCLGHLGRKDEAKPELAALLASKPDFRTRGRVLIGRLVKFPDLVETIADGLRKAGLALDEARPRVASGSRPRVPQG
jgi:adenylate cyclase